MTPGSEALGATSPPRATAEWPVRLFRRSVLKQQKYRAITGLLGSVAGRRCLDIGSDSGVVSYLLRQGGGDWASADLDPAAVASIRALVETDVHQLDGGRTRFRDDEFDCVVIVDLLEHLTDDRKFVDELHRIVRPGGIVIANVPYPHHGLLRRLRDSLGQTDEQHGHVRPGYTLETLGALLEGRFTLSVAHRYSGFFAEATDALLIWGLGRLKGGAQGSKKGVIVGETNLKRHARLFRAYSMIYPFVWGLSQLDRILWWQPGYMLIAKATVNKPTPVGPQSREFTAKGST